MRLIYDSGPLPRMEQLIALFGATIVFVLSFTIVTIPFWVVVQNGFQLIGLFFGAFAIFIGLLLFVMGINLLAPVVQRFSTKIYLNGSKFEVRRPFPLKMLDQVLDRDRINTIEVMHRRKGGSSIFVLYRFGSEGPHMKDSDSIGPFYRSNQAEDVAAAIQAELLPENFDADQIKQNDKLQQRIVFRIVTVFCVIFELIVCSSLIMSWNQPGFAGKLIAILMAGFPPYLWYQIRRSQTGMDAC